MFFAAAVYNGKPGKWELLHDHSELEDRHMFKSSLEIQPISTQDIRGVTYPTKGIAHKYRGPFAIDLDTNKKKGLNTVEQVRALTIHILRSMQKSLKLDPNSNGIKIYFSGSKGYHIEIDQILFGMDKDKYYSSLPHIYKGVAMKMKIDKSIDMSIYSSGWGRLWRRANIRRDNGSHKIPISFDELVNLHSDKHAGMSRTPRMEAPKMNGVQVNQRMSKLFQLSFDVDRSRRKVGLTHRDFKELIPAAFDKSDCISKILNNHVSVDKTANFHHMSFIMATYFVNMGYSWEQVARESKNWIEAIQSQTYSTVPIRWDHFHSNFKQVQGGGYKFSCGAVRNLVEVCYCATCPLNKDPDWGAKTATGGVIEWEGTYQVGVAPKEGGEWRVEEKTNGIFIPTAVGTTDGKRNMEAIQNFNCHIQYSDKSKSPEFNLDFLEFTSEENLIKHVQKINGVGGNIWSSFCLSKKQFQGIRQIIGERMKNLPHYLSTGATHGAFRFKDKWYWADNEGARNDKWGNTGNVLCDQPYAAGGDDSYFKQHLTAHEIYSRSDKEDFKEAIRALRLVEKINSPHIMYLTMGWAVASFFRPRFFDLKSKTPNPNVHTFPLLFHIGKAQTGKTTLDNEVLIPLMGYGTESMGEKDSSLINIKVFALSPFSLFMHISKASNGCPIFLDEFKDEFTGDGNNSAKFARSDMDTLCRLSYDRSVFTRGSATSGLNTNTISSTFKINTPKLGLNSLDQASYQRSILVYADERMSKMYTGNFETFYKMKSGKPIMQRIGATVAKFVLSLSDERLVKMLDRAKAYAEKFFPGGGSRRQEGLSKIIFGNMVIQKLFTKYAWDLERSVKVCAMAYAYMDGKGASDHMKEISGDEDFGLGEMSELISSDGKGGRSDWDIMMGEVLDLTAVASDKDRLKHGYEYFFQRADGLEVDYYMVVNVKAALHKLNVYNRMSKSGSGIIMSDADFRIGAKVSRVLVKTQDGKDFTPFARPEDGGDIIRGQFIRLSVKKMTASGFDLRGIPGSEDALQGLNRGDY